MEKANAQLALILIGSEILGGLVQEANLKWLAEYCRQWGLSIKETIIINDEEEIIKQTLERFCQKYQTVVVTGGLGPTEDDITKKALASLLKCQLGHSPETEKMVRAHYQRFGREWTPGLNDYPIIPKGVTPLHNPRGLAPGFKLNLHSAALFFLPGVPREFQAMVEEHFPQSLQERKILSTPLNSLYFRTTRVPEEKIYKELSPNLWSFLSQFGSVSSLPREHGVDIVVKLFDQQAEVKAEELLMAPELQPLLPYLWATSLVSPYEKVYEILKVKKKTLATAESCTGGLLAHELTQLAGISDVYFGSIVSYTNQAKTKLLQVAPELIQLHGPVSRPVVEQMALAAKKVFNTDYAIATSGIAGPDGGTIEKPVGTFTWALCTPEEVIVKEGWFPGDRIRLKQRFAYAALFELLFSLKK